MPVLCRPRAIAYIALAFFVIALFLDTPVATSVHAHDFGPPVRASRIATVIKWPGDFRFTVALSLTLLVIDRKQWRGVAVLILGGILSGLFYTIIKWTVGRTRPFPRSGPVYPPFELHPFPLGIAGLWKANNQAFPSGHVCLAFATVAGMCMIFPRACAICMLWATLIGIERVIEGAHYPSDVVAGAIFGVLATQLAAFVVHRCFAERLLPIAGRL
jgi:membrane-associated phospholipid phosphatase